MNWLDEEKDRDLIDLVHDIIGDKLWKAIGGYEPDRSYPRYDTSLSERIKHLCEAFYQCPELFETWNGDESCEGSNENYAEMCIVASQVLDE